MGAGFGFASAVGFVVWVFGGVCDFGGGGLVFSFGVGLPVPGFSAVSFYVIGVV